MKTELIQGLLLLRDEPMSWTTNHQSPDAIHEMVVGGINFVRAGGSRVLMHVHDLDNQEHQREMDVSKVRNIIDNIFRSFGAQKDLEHTLTVGPADKDYLTILIQVRA